jgi:hypothetical protein
MNIRAPFTKQIVHKWLSFGLLFGFVYYWLFTFSLVFFNKTTRTVAPRQSLLYSSFFNQNWRLFASTKPYNIEVNLVVKKINDTAVADTVQVVQYNMAERRRHAPFNNYQEALDKLFIFITLEMEKIAGQKKLLLKKQFPARDENFYTSEASAAIERDSLYREQIDNLNNYSKYVLAQKNIRTAGKAFQLEIVHKYILPAKAPVASGANTETIFVSTFKPL